MNEIFLKGGPVMYPLLGCSIISLTVVIERTLFWLRVDLRHNRALVNEVLTLAQAGDWESIRERVAGSKDYVTRILVTGIVHREFSMGRAMEAAAADELKRMRRFLDVLDTMVTVAPLLGILGTVIGIILSFELLGTGSIEDPRAVTAGISQALLTTAAGLTIAIFSVIPFNYFQGRVESAAITIEQYATSLEIVFDKLIQAAENGTEASK